MTDSVSAPEARIAVTVDGVGYAAPPDAAPPDAAAQPNDAQWVSLAPGLRFLRPYLRQVAGATVALLVTAAATLALGQGVKSLIDHGFRSGALNDSLLLMAGVVAVLTLGRLYAKE